MSEPLITGSMIAAGWKVLGSLYEKYQAWSVRRSSSKRAMVLKEQAEELMNRINRKILSGCSSDDPDLVPLINEFRNLLAQDAKPVGHEKTEDWIARSVKPSVVGTVSAAKKATAQSATKKPAAKKATAQSATKKPAAKKATAQSATKKPAAKKA